MLRNGRNNHGAEAGLLPAAALDEELGEGGKSMGRTICRVAVLK